MYEKDRTTEWATSKDGRVTPILAEWKDGRIVKIKVGDREFVPAEKPRSFWRMILRA